MLRDRALYAAAMAALLTSSACDPAAPAVGVTVPRSPPGRPGPAAAVEHAGPALGDDGWGHALASSANGRFAVVRGWEPGVMPTFTQHGGSPDPVKIELLDFVTAKVEPIDDLVDVDPSRRFLLIMVDRAFVLIDAKSGARETLDDIDRGDDRNRCLPPRSANFSATGLLGWVNAGATALNVKQLDAESLEAGERWSIPARGRLWRGWALGSDHSACLLEVADASGDWPLQGTSCECRWCGAFAMSMGFYGWHGPNFEAVNVAADGERSAGTPPEAEWPYHGPSDDGCELVGARAQEPLSAGPWHWECGATPGQASHLRDGQRSPS